MARLFLFIITTMLICDSIFTASIQKPYNPMFNDVMAVKKRPFCNAFTGCGRKRSQSTNDLPALENFLQLQYTASVPEIEPALDDLSQLVADIELWGSIRDEILRRRY